MLVCIWKTKAERDIIDSHSKNTILWLKSISINAFAILMIGFEINEKLVQPRNCFKWEIIQNYSKESTLPNHYSMVWHTSLQIQQSIMVRHWRYLVKLSLACSFTCGGVWLKAKFMEYLARIKFIFHLKGQPNWLFIFAQ